jgi:UV DNA damage endonuclease
MTNHSNSLPKLGLCCLTSDGVISYKTITKKRFDSLSDKDKYTALAKIYKANIDMFVSAINYCATNDIKMYRVTSHLFPFYETEIGVSILATLSNELKTIGNTAKTLDIRVVMHPDQWVVLSSDSSETISRSVDELIHHAIMFDLMGFSRTHFNLLNVHGGKRGNSTTLIKVINDLPHRIKSRLTLENDERCYSTKELFKVHELTNVPILFDFHHSLVNNKLCSYNHRIIKQEFELAKSTWGNSTDVTTHISNGTTGLLDSRHSDYITNFPEVMLDAPWVEVEARSKELALRQLENDLENYYA